MDEELAFLCGLRGGRRGLLRQEKVLRLLRPLQHHNVLLDHDPCNGLQLFTSAVPPLGVEKEFCSAEVSECQHGRVLDTPKGYPDLRGLNVRCSLDQIT